MVLAKLLAIFLFSFVHSHPRNLPTSSDQPATPQVKTTNKGMGMGMGMGRPRQCKGSFSYALQVEFDYSQASHPLNYLESLHFSPIVVASHSDDYSMFQVGDMSTAGLQMVAEMGNGMVLSQEISASDEALTNQIFSTGAPFARDGTTEYIHVEVDEDHPYISLVSMIAPSPDWFTGASAINMCDEMTGKWKTEMDGYMFSYDSGTDSGDMFESDNAPTSPATYVSRIECGDEDAFCSEGTNAPIASYSIVAKKKCKGDFSYALQVQFDYSQASHPLNYLDSLHFSPIVVASHSDDYSMFKVGDMSTSGLQMVAEMGNGMVLSEEIEASYAALTNQIFSTGAPFARDGTTGYIDIKVDEYHPYISFVTMIAPSPDWFTGASAINMCDELTGMWKTEEMDGYMFSYDSGTDSGDMFESDNAPTSPATYVSRIECGDEDAFCSEGMNAPIASYSIMGKKKCEGAFSYGLQVQFDYSQASHPLNYLDSLHFSPIVVASHSGDYSMFKVGDMSTAGLQMVAEMGNGMVLSEEIAASYDALTNEIFSAGAPFARDATTGYINVVVDKYHPYISFVTMIAPSPDWFTGASAINMCDEMTGMWKTEMDGYMFSYDSGTDSGDMFESVNDPTSPATYVSRIECGDEDAFCSEGMNPPIAHYAIMSI